MALRSSAAVRMVAAGRFGVPADGADGAKAAGGAPWPLLLIEHGETPFDRQKRVHGNLDPPLTNRGRVQALQLGERLAQLTPKPNRLYTSDRRRALETSVLAGLTASIPVTVTSALRPLDTGVWSGGNEARVAERLKPYFSHPQRRIPGGERVAQWRQRHLDFTRRLLQAARQQGERPALVTHSNVIGSLAAQATGGKDGRTAMAHPPRSGSFTTVAFPLAGSVSGSRG